MTDLTGKRVALLVANEGVEQIELESPRRALDDAGATTTLVSVDPGKVQAFHHLDRGDVFPVDATVGDVDPDGFDALAAT